MTSHAAGFFRVGTPEEDCVWYCDDKFRIYRFAPTHCKRHITEYQHRNCGWKILASGDRE